MSSFLGTYHLSAFFFCFFQYNPLDIKPGKFNYWGHYATRDYTHYICCEPALAADSDDDKNGVYSGSAYIEDGVMHLYYTGNVKHPGQHDYTHTGREHNTMTVVSEDGFHFGPKKKLLTNVDYPSDDTLHVRDPKVFKLNGKKYMVLGARTNADAGEVLLYSESKPDQWDLVNRIATDEPFGYMWECPDLYELGGKIFLSISPQGLDADDWRYNNVYQSGTFIFNGNLEGEYDLKDFEEYDHGFDFYAPQTFEDESGRRILIGWMGLPDIPYDNPTADAGWMQALTMPRLLSVNAEGRLCQNPLPEFESLREDHRAVPLKNETVTETIASQAEIDIDLEKSVGFTVEIFDDCVITWNGKELSLKFGASGCGRNIRRVPLEHIERLRIFIDNSSIEIFANDGSAVFTSRFYPESKKTSITFEGIEGTADIYQLKSFSYERK